MNKDVIYYRSVAFVAIVAVIVLASWKVATDKSAAKARQLQGMYIFNDCLPASEYQVLGTVSRNPTVSFKSSQYESIRDMLITRAKKEYPGAEGIILDLRDGGTDRADVIKFK